MTTTLDSILSGGGEAMPSTDTTTAPQETPQTETGGQQPPADPPQSETISPDDEGTEGGQKTVPLTALHAERQKVKRYTEEVADFRKSNETLQRQVSELLQRIPAPQQQPQQAPDFFENPNAAVLNTVAPHFESQAQVVMHLSQKVAALEHGADKVKEAEDAFVQAVQSGTLDRADYQKVVNSQNRYEAAVEWHQRQERLKPDYETNLRATIEAELLAKHGITPGGSNSGAPAAPTPVMPSNIAGARNVGSRSGPAWSGPPKLDDIFKR